VIASRSGVVVCAVPRAQPQRVAAPRGPLRQRMLQLGASLLVILAATACRRGMVDQQKIKPLAEENFFSDSRASRLPPAHTVARGELREDQQFYTGKIGKELAATFPMPVTRELLSRGRERFNIYCAVCHAPAGAGNGMIVQRGFPQPPSFHEPRLRDAPIGHFVDVITNGYGVMYSYASRVAPEDRWAIAAYIRALQVSQHAAPSDAEPEAAHKLETAQQ
jgi:mono/diheme cytochrome c family protein